MQRLTSFLLAVALTPGAAQAEEPSLPSFDVAAFAAPKPNPYVVLEPGYSLMLAGTQGDGTLERDVMTVMGPGPEIMGVATTTVQDDAFEDGRLVEQTFDYCATDAEGNLWYFGEDVTNYRYDAAGKQTGSDTQSSWRAAVDGAQPGISVPGVPEVGKVTFQEYAPAQEATDFAEVIAVDVEITDAGQEYRDVLQLFEASTSEPDLREFKYFAKGAGLVRAEENLSPSRDAPEMVFDIQP